MLSSGFNPAVAVLAGMAVVATAASTLRATSARCMIPSYARGDRKRCLLISNSKLAGLGYLDHVMCHIQTFLGAPSGPILFVPYAQRDRDGYAAKFRAAMAASGHKVHSLHECGTSSERMAAVNGAAAIFVGGGNTYRLLKSLQQDPELLARIAARVANGELAYIGSSAGTNLACPTIRNSAGRPSTVFLPRI